MNDPRISHPGENCWRIEPADRVAFLIDAERYYAAFREAVLRARRRLFILGWDIDSTLRLVRDGGGQDPGLGAFLNDVVSHRPDLEAYVLIWDFAMIYTFEREWLPVYRLGWKTHRRLHFRLDDRHPVGGSQHQKVVVIDDALAFTGGMDLSKSRWDTPEHRPDEPRRVDSDGSGYVPYHDVQVMLDGEAAVALGELARERWHRATGQRLAPPEPAGDPWPATVEPDLTGVDVTLARTLPRHGARPEVREVERLFLDGIAAARERLYIENQYLTSKVIRDALAARLEEADGPEVVIVVPLRTGGWLEQNTMDVLRGRLVRHLRGADRHGRLRVLWPRIPGLAPRHLSVHSKVMVVDDRLVRVGSANLSNRSMGLDSECDVAIEGEAPRVRRAVAGLRDRLLAEHLGVDVAQVEGFLADHGSLTALVDAHAGRDRSLQPLDEEALRVDPQVEALVAESEIVDPERPVEPDELVEYILPKEHTRPAWRGVISILVTLAALLALAAAWRWTPLHQWLDVPSTVAALARFQGHPLAVPAAVGGFVAGGLAMVPVTFLVVVTVLVFGPLQGFLVALTGSLASAALTYGLGHHFGRRTVRRMAGARLNRLSRQLARRGLLTIIGVRVIPVAPFTVVNLVAGASHIRFGTYMLGTLLGMSPGLLGLSAFLDRLIAAMRHPSAFNFALIVALLAVLAGGALLLRRWLRRRRALNGGS